MSKRIGGPRRRTRRTFKKEFRDAGKISIRKYFQSFKAGDKVCLNSEPAVQGGMYHSRYHGKTATVLGRRGECYVLGLKDCRVDKTLIVHPVHLKKAGP
ncbi:50S ribosomal protein L21e [Candidatus Woesearchaeota archaeon]|nr:50S ribosomal protein L21e [Candidatus Woesearchaeota archaeon]